MSVATDPRKPIRITVDLDPELHRMLKVAAAATGKTISEIVRTGLHGYVRRVVEGEQPLPPSPPPAQIPRRSEFALPRSEFDLSPLLAATEIVGD